MASACHIEATPAQSTAAEPPARSVLLIEDDHAIREQLRIHLSLAGFDVEEIANGRAALERARRAKFDLIVLEVMLPGVDGVMLCRALRAKGANVGTGIMMLTASDAESDKVLGLESGADDYLTKPFGIREFMARVAALVRRQARAASTSAAGGRTRFSSHDISIDRGRRRVTRRGESIDLTRQEFELLQLLASRPGIVFSRAALLSRVWGQDSYVTERTVDTVVSRLRRKIERRVEDPELILTTWGVGYKFADVD